MAKVEMWATLDDWITYSFQLISEVVNLLFKSLKSLLIFWCIGWLWKAFILWGAHSLLQLSFKCIMTFLECSLFLLVLKNDTRLKTNSAVGHADQHHKHAASGLDSLANEVIACEIMWANQWTVANPDEWGTELSTPSKNHLRPYKQAANSSILTDEDKLRRGESNTTYGRKYGSARWPLTSELSCKVSTNFIRAILPKHWAVENDLTHKSHVIWQQALRLRLSRWNRKIPKGSLDKKFSVLTFFTWLSAAARSDSSLSFRSCTLVHSLWATRYRCSKVAILSSWSSLCATDCNTSINAQAETKQFMRLDEVREVMPSIHLRWHMIKCLTNDDDQTEQNLLIWANQSTVIK